MTINYLPRQFNTRKYILPLTLLATAVLTGCASMRGLHTEGTLTDAASLHAERKFANVATTPAAWPAVDWWTRLGDKQLDSLIDEALKDNPDLAGADARARAAQSQVDTANARRLPHRNSRRQEEWEGGPADHLRDALPARRIDENQNE